MNLEKIFNPSSIAIVGVSTEEQKVGHLVAKNLIAQGFEGEMYFINNKFEGEIFGKKVYKSLSEIKKPIDLVVLAVPAYVSLVLLDEVYQCGIKNVVIYAAGFKEMGEVGQENERLLLQKAKKYDLNILGPNCIGYVNTTKNINVTFLKHICPSGNIGFISQSGALGSMLVDYFVAHKNLGFSYFVSLGNKSVIDESDILDFMAKSKEVEVIGMYLEDVKNGKKFEEVLKKASKIKPIVVIKAGTTAEGSKAAISHTGGMVGNDQVYSAVFKQNGVIRAESMTQFLTILKILSYKKIPTSSSILVLSNAGGVGVLLTDEIIKNKLSLVTISDSTKQSIINSMGGSTKITIRNPIDLLGDASAFDYDQVISATLEEKEIGSIVVLLTPQANTQIHETAKIIVKIQNRFHKPIYPIFMGEKSVKDLELYFEENKVAGFLSCDGLPKILSEIIWQQKYLKSTFEAQRQPDIDLTSVKNILTKTIEENNGKAFLNLNDSFSVLKTIGVPTVDLFVPKSETELKKVADEIGFPLVAKLLSDKFTHKTDVKGVFVGLKNHEELLDAYKQIKRIDPQGDCLIQKMVKGQEILIGAKRDPNFGTVLVLGMGGVFTELFKDITYRVYPFSYQEFLAMIEETKLAKIIKGFRGSAPIDSKKLYDIFTKIGWLMENFTQIKEIDINPLMASGEGLAVVDCRIIL